MSIKNNFPIIHPSLNLDFANSKVLDPRITFSRGSTATYYDGKTVAKAEENLWYPSNDGLGGSIEVTKTANAAVAPDGTTTALLIVPNTVTGNHVGGYRSFPLVDAVAFFSFYVKASGYDKVRVGDGSAGRMYGTFDLTALSVTASGGAAYLDSGIIDVGNSWRRCWIKYNNNVGSLGFALTVTPIPTGATVNNYGSATGTGDGTSGVYFWGFQVEQRSALTALTQTTTAPITNYIPALQTAAANVARFDHDPVTGESKGLLIEEQRTNLLTYSEFQNGANTSGGVLQGTMIGPTGGTVNAAVFTSGSAQIYLLPTSPITLAASTTYAVSVFVKMDDGGVPVFNGAGITTASTNDFVLIAGNSAVLPQNTTAQHVGNGLYRVSGSVTTGTTNLGNNYIFRYSSNSGRGFKVTGWQIETGAFPTSYIPTASAQVTRSADAASIIGTNFSSWYRADEGTLFSESICYGIASVGSSTAFSLIGANVNDRIRTGNSSGVVGSFPTGIGGDVAVGGSVQAGFGFTPQMSAFAKSAIAYKTNDFCGAANGVIGTTDTSGTVPVVNRSGIGGLDTGREINGTIKRIAYYPTRLSNTELQALTA